MCLFVSSQTIRHPPPPLYSLLSPPFAYSNSIQLLSISFNFISKVNPLALRVAAAASSSSATSITANLLS
ncbi:hypothetical protein EYC80_003307 [Monilinia laxa]|uniref:Uncharacterized protein n=1 Tax=Monilinia laxa TaxID=61186 RepID=A0A5N6KDB9_MONLA|nr:hypothetical protein EYC80_003307 [Monilinia laxa]